MKKVIEGFVVLAVCVACVFAVVCAGKTYAEDMGHSYDERDLYALTTVVAEVDRECNTVYCVDCNGEEWAFWGCEDWEEGDIASLLMYTSGTPIIYDDAILDVKYGGYFEAWEG